MFQPNKLSRLDQIRNMIQEVLEEKNQPMHVKDIAKRVEEMDSSISYSNVATTLSKHTATFERVSTVKQSRGLWGLCSWRA